ncbi:hypothetical protein AAMO2058_000349800 [Amorphochlora amoebiformis]
MSGNPVSEDQKSPLPAVRMLSPIRQWRTDSTEEAQKAEAAYLFKWIAITGMFVYMEAGAIPGMLKQLKARFNLDYFQLGILGSVVYLSLSLGCPIFAWLYRRYNAKNVLGITLIVNNITMLMFALCPTSFPNLFISLRAMIGLSQAGLVVYTPVWIDDFAPKGRHATWMACQQASTPFGIMLGYLAASLFAFIGRDTLGGMYTFRYPFLIQVVLVTPYLVLVWFVPSAHINVVAAFKLELSSYGSEVVWEKQLPEPSKSDIDLPQRSISLVLQSHIHPLSASSNRSEKANPTSDADLQPNHISDGEEPKPSSQLLDPGLNLTSKSIPTSPMRRVKSEMKEGIPMTETADIPVSPPWPDEYALGGVDTRGEDISSFQLKFGQRLGGETVEEILTLLKNTTYVSIVLSLTALYFVVTGIQYWGTDYLESELNGHPATVRLQFLFTSATAPVAGVIFGGWFVEYVGGYKGAVSRKRALGWLLIFGTFSCISAIFVTVVDSTWGAVVFMWILLFFGATVLPGGSGVFISVIPVSLRTIGSSFAAIIFNLFGYFLSPFLSGFISEKSHSLTLGFRIVLGWSSIALFFFGVAYYTAPKEERRYDALSKDEDLDISGSNTFSSPLAREVQPPENNNRI